MTARPVLYSFRRCPYAMRARLALLASGTVCEIREVKLARKPADMIAVSPKATVPVIMLPGGAVIEESLDIMRWALGRNDPEGWRERDDGSLIEANDGPFKRHLDRYKYADRHASDPAEHRAGGLQILGVLEGRLAAHANLCGDGMGITDARNLSVCQAVRGDGPRVVRCAAPAAPAGLARRPSRLTAFHGGNGQAGALATGR